jgi:hypothetical protein
MFKGYFPPEFGLPLRTTCPSHRILQDLTHRIRPIRVIIFILLFLFLVARMGWDWVHLVRRPLTGLLYQPRMIDDECGAVGGMRIGRGNRSTRRKLTPVPLYLPQIPHDLSWARIRATTNSLSYGTASILPLLPSCWVQTFSSTESFLYLLSLKSAYTFADHKDWGYRLGCKAM